VNGNLGTTLGIFVEATHNECIDVIYGRREIRT